MLKLVVTLARIFAGFVLASITAGFAMVMFVNTPVDVLTQPTRQLPETAGHVLNLTLLTATQAAIFAAVFVLLAALVGELFSIRKLAFYLICGIAIALLGFVAQYVSEALGEPTVLNNYAFKAFLTSGFFGGFVYWLTAGQFAGHPPGVSSEKSARGGKPAEAKPALSHDTAAVIVMNPTWKAQSRGGFVSFFNRPGR